MYYVRFMNVDFLNYNNYLHLQARFYLYLKPILHDSFESLLHFHFLWITYEHFPTKSAINRFDSCKFALFAGWQNLWMGGVTFWRANLAPIPYRRLDYVNFNCFYDYVLDFSKAKNHFNGFYKILDIKIVIEQLNYSFCFKNNL